MKAPDDPLQWLPENTATLLEMVAIGQTSVEKAARLAKQLSRELSRQSSLLKRLGLPDGPAVHVAGVDAEHIIRAYQSTQSDQGSLLAPVSAPFDQLMELAEARDIAFDHTAAALITATSIADRIRPSTTAEEFHAWLAAAKDDENLLRFVIDILGGPSMSMSKPDGRKLHFIGGSNIPAYVLGAEAKVIKHLEIVRSATDGDIVLKPPKARKGSYLCLDEDLVVDFVVSRRQRLLCDVTILPAYPTGLKATVQGEIVAATFYRLAELDLA